MFCVDLEKIVRLGTLFEPFEYFTIGFQNQCFKKHFSKKCLRLAFLARLVFCSLFYCLFNSQSLELSSYFNEQKLHFSQHYLQIFKPISCKAFFKKVIPTNWLKIYKDLICSLNNVLRRFRENRQTGDLIWAIWIFYNWFSKPMFWKAFFKKVFPTNWLKFTETWFVV